MMLLHLTYAALTAFTSPAPVVAPALADSAPLLTVDALTRMTKFWTAFLQTPDSVKTAGRAANQGSISIDIGTGTPGQMRVLNMSAMATKFPIVATELQKVQLTAQQWEQYRAALLTATIAMQQSATPAASSALAQNMAFLQSHQTEFAALKAAGMWFPAANPAPAGGQIASPRDTTRATIGAARVLVDYGRPSKRGRAIFGGLVPYGEVWRTGANEATTLVTDKDLLIGKQVVPAGTYTLFTIPSESGWKLIINKENGQWGLSYRPELDLGRTDMTVSTAKEPVEKFLIDFTDGMMRLQWDTTVIQVPVAEKK